MVTPLPVAERLLVFAVGLFAMALATGEVVFVFHTSLAVFLAFQLVAKAPKD